MCKVPGVEILDLLNVAKHSLDPDNKINNIFMTGVFALKLGRKIWLQIHMEGSKKNKK